MGDESEATVKKWARVVAARQELSNLKLKVFKKHPLPWKIVLAGKPCGKPFDSIGPTDSPTPIYPTAEDNSIFDANGGEVLGCSEWLRCDLTTLELIVALATANPDG